MTEVVVRYGLESALRQLNRKLEFDGDLKRVKERENGYVKRSVRKRQKHQKAVSRLRKLKRQ